MDNHEKALREEYQMLNQQLQHPDVFGRTDYPTLARRQGELARIIDLFDKQKNLVTQLEDAKKMVGGNDAELAELAQKEFLQLERDISKIRAELNFFLVPKDPNDERDCIVEIRAAAG